MYVVVIGAVAVIGAEYEAEVGEEDDSVGDTVEDVDTGGSLLSGTEYL